MRNDETISEERRMLKREMRQAADPEFVVYVVREELNERCWIKVGRAFKNGPHDGDGYTIEFGSGITGVSGKVVLRREDLPTDSESYQIYPTTPSKPKLVRG